MVVTRVTVRDIRSHERAVLEPGPGLTVLHGPNGAGKTNLLEALYLGCTGRGFRASGDRELVRFGAQAGRVEVRGYAFAGGERHVARVDVSLDGGTTWSLAELLEDLGPWAWRQWRTTVELAPGDHEIVVRAWDSSAATQPEDEAALWNPKGYVNNSWPRVTVTVA